MFSSTTVYYQPSFNHAVFPGMSTLLKKEISRSSFSSSNLIPQGRCKRSSVEDGSEFADEQSVYRMVCRWCVNRSGRTILFYSGVSATPGEFSSLRPRRCRHLSGNTSSPAHQCSLSTEDLPFDLSLKLDQIFLIALSSTVTL